MSYLSGSSQYSVPCSVTSKKSKVVMIPVQSTTIFLSIRLTSLVCIKSIANRAAPHFLEEWKLRDCICFSFRFCQLPFTI